MKSLIKFLAVAAAFGLVPAAAVAQGAAPAQTPEQLTGAAAAPAPQSNAGTLVQPEQVSDPAIANPGGEEPSDAQVAQTLQGRPTEASGLTPASTVAPVSPEVGIGQPDGRMNLQDQFTPIGEQAAWFHNVILLPVIAAISIFVLVLLLYVIVRYRRSANPIPSRTTHNTTIEVIWTLVPVLVLVAIAVPSIKLLANQYDPPAADITVKAIGNQWYWTYQYPDNGDFEIISNPLSDADAKARGEPRQLAVDERMVVPAGATVKVIVTSNDVIHAFWVPAFWNKIDAVPGRLNETWFKVDRPGVYYGQCTELCGARHAYMPIAVEVMPPAQFAAWVASKGGTMPGQVAPTSSDATQNSPILNPGAAAAGGGPVPTAGGSATETSPEPSNLIDATATPPVSSQGAAESRRGSE